MVYKILLVDDESDVLEFQKSYLARRNYTVLTAANTARAMQIIKQELPDIVFCDIRLESDRAGLEILGYAKQIKPDIIFYLVTGLLDKDILEEGFSLGAKEVITKPILNEDVEKRIKSAIEEHKSL